MRDRLVFLQELVASGDVLLFARILAFAAVVPLVYRFRLSLVERVIGIPVAADPAEAPRVRKIARYVQVAQWIGRPVVRPGCLTRGTTLCRFLRRAGADVHLCFGIGLPPEDQAGHCWLEVNGEPFLERRDPRRYYAQTYRIPAASTAG